MCNHETMVEINARAKRAADLAADMFAGCGQGIPAGERGRLERLIQDAYFRVRATTRVLNGHPALRPTSEGTAE